MTHDEMIAVLTAAKEGKQIQLKTRTQARWHDIDKPAWNFEECDYRVKPEPRRWWVEYRDGIVFDAREEYVEGYTEFVEVVK